MARQKPPISTWIISERKRLGWKAEELSRRLVEQGYPAEISTVRVWEAGRAPRTETVEALERLFGSKAPSDEPESGDLAAAVRELVEEVRLSRLSSERSAEVLAELLGVALAGRLPQSESATGGGARARRGAG